MKTLNNDKLNQVIDYKNSQLEHAQKHLDIEVKEFKDFINNASAWEIATYAQNKLDRIISHDREVNEIETTLNTLSYLQR